MSKSASLPAELYENPQQPQGTPGWKEEVNQRLAAHRTRRGNTQEAPGSQESQGARAASDRAAAAAARVAARYAKAPSYSELLAGEARAVVRAAGQAAQAARSAQAAAQAVLAGLEAGMEPLANGQYWEPASAQPAQAPQAAQTAARWQDEPAPAPAPRWQEEPPAPAAESDVWSEMRVYPAPAPAHTVRPEAAREYRRNRGEAQEYDASETDLFPADPYAAAVVEPVQHLPANLIEFPRELVATRKARPRLAEGPFYNPAQEEAQLNIFEPAQSSQAAAAPVAPPEWASIELEEPRQDADAGPAAPAQAYAHLPEMLSPGVEEPSVEEEQAGSGFASAATPYSALPYSAPPYEAGLASPSVSAPEISVQASVQAAPAQPARKAAVKPEAAPAPELLVAAVSDRMLATVVDAALVTLAYLAAAVVVLASTTHPPAGRIALIASACGVALFWVLYQFLFLSYAEEGTPGMRYARIALCTFEDDNPTLDQMRMRIPALILAALPAGLGLAWALWDKDHLGWQDRLTKTYQRKY